MPRPTPALREFPATARRCCGAVRFERHWRFGITQSFPVSQDVAIVVQVQRDIVSSLPLYNYTSNSVLVGPQIRF